MKSLHLPLDEELDAALEAVSVRQNREKICVVTDALRKYVKSGRAKDCKTRTMDKDKACYFRDQLRQARANALKDAQAFDEIIHVLERLGQYLLGCEGDLGKYEDKICVQAEKSPLATIPNEWRHLHTPFRKLYGIVRRARNDAMHEGAFARHLTEHTIELSIILEHSLMDDSDRVSDYMVGNPVRAELWQPLIDKSDRSVIIGI